MKILLVEDDRLLAREIARALREENFAVDVAADGEDGQHLGETEFYDAAVLDLGLPRVPGVEVLRGTATVGAGRNAPERQRGPTPGAASTIRSAVLAAAEPARLRAVSKRPAT